MKISLTVAAFVVPALFVGCLLVAAAGAAAPGETTPVATTSSALLNPAPQIDPAAMALLRKVQTAMFAPNHYRAECWTTQTWDPSPTGQEYGRRYEMSTLTAEKPNRMRYDSWPMTVDAQGKWSKEKETPDYTYVSDGKTRWLQFGPNYRTDTKTTPNWMGTQLEPWGGFYTLDASPYGSAEYERKHGELREARRDGSETVEGVLCDKVFTHAKVVYDAKEQEYRTTWYIGPDGFVRRKTEHVQIGAKGWTLDATLRNIQTDFTIAHPETLFAYVPPPGVKSFEQREAERPPLLATGTIAPDFTAVDRDGKTVKLSDFQGKIVVVDFWASWCAPCKASMPNTQEVAKGLHTANVPVVVLMVDNGEERPAFAEWVGAHPELDALRFVYADPKARNVSGKDYKVTGIPSRYVIDANGIIRASLVGYGGPADHLEKDVRAAMEPLSTK